MTDFTHLGLINITSLVKSLPDFFIQVDISKQQKKKGVYINMNVETLKLMLELYMYFRKVTQLFLNDVQTLISIIYNNSVILFYKQTPIEDVYRLIAKQDYVV